jgi:hypothetical protein
VPICQIDDGLIWRKLMSGLEERGLVDICRLAVTLRGVPAQPSR